MFQGVSKVMNYCKEISKQHTHASYRNTGKVITVNSIIEYYLILNTYIKFL